MMKRKSFAALLVIAISLMTALPAFAIDIDIDGIPVQMDQQPVIDSGRTLVPMRAVFEAFGADVSWNQETQTVTAVKDQTTIRLQIGNKTALVNDREQVLDVPAKIVNNRTLVPLRFVGEALGAKVTWDGNVHIYYQTPKPDTETETRDIHIPKELFKVIVHFDELSRDYSYFIDQNNILVQSKANPTLAKKVLPELEKLKKDIQADQKALQGMTNYRSAEQLNTAYDELANSIAYSKAQLNGANNPGAVLSSFERALQQYVLAEETLLKELYNIPV